MKKYIPVIEHILTKNDWSIIKTTKKDHRVIML